ncbi:heat shock 70 kDa protein 14 isoform X3 [Cryptomeria japonica]|uniref:heat shock 70 kDa protein 14 isoform X3 n=1 Tax=Cryptomeria japonica TaxID=3369 RepID=UPI0025AB8111|nr:heat shock 70 kDa protein 14 isoform X3 [Cryptomeria japonica]
MSIIGLDIGNENCVVAVAKQCGIDVVLNDEAKRETPAMVCFGEKQRFLGTAAVASATMNPKSTISQIKRLLGRKFSDPEVQKDLRLFPFEASESPLDGCVLIHVNYMSENNKFSLTQILGMILSNLKQIAMKSLETTAVSHCVIGIPAYFTDLQRRAYLDAATIANLKPIRLMHESAAIALDYGIYKTDLPEIEQIIVVFVDVGHSDTQVSVAAFKKGQVKMLSHAFDRSLGGRDFDEVLFNHFAQKFKEEYKIDILTNHRASLRLRAACEKLKRVLSANAEASLNIECLMEKDVRGFIKREEFETLSFDLLERIKVPCKKALEDAQLSSHKIYAVEVVGSGSRIPAIMRVLSEFFKKALSRTLNASECIARGCALQCAMQAAMLSRTFRVRKFEVQDSFPFSVALCSKSPASETDEESVPTPSDRFLFSKGDPIPSTKVLSLCKSGPTFTLDADYVDTGDLPPGTSPKITTFTIGPFQATKSEKPRIEVKVGLNLHGIITIESASLIEEVGIPVTESPASREIKKNKDVELSADAAGDDAGKCYASTGSTSPIAINSRQHMKKSKRTDTLDNEVVNRGLPQEELQKAVEKEVDLARQDKIMEETKDTKNAVESYIYDMRNKLSDIYHNYATESEREKISRDLQQTEDWLYGEGDDETKEVFIKKLDELKNIGDAIEQRYKEKGAHSQAAADLMHDITSNRNLAPYRDTKYDHIDPKDRQKWDYCLVWFGFT